MSSIVELKSYQIRVTSNGSYPIVDAQELNSCSTVTRDELPADIRLAKAYLSNPNSKIYANRLIKRSIFNKAIEIVNEIIKNSNESIEMLDYMLETGLISIADYNHAIKINHAFTLNGYYASRIANITYKVAAVLSILSKHRGMYNKRWYNNLSSDKDYYNTYKYEDVSYIPSEELKSICGTNTATDYTVIKHCLIKSGSIVELSSHWAYKTEELDELTGIIKELGESVAKPYWINPELIKEINTNDEIISIPSNGIFNNVAKSIKDLNDNYFGALNGILHLTISDQIYESAKLRASMSSSKRIVVEGQEDSVNENTKYTWVNSLPVEIKDKNNRFCGQVMLSSQTANIIMAIYEFDLFTLLKYTIDEYAGRLHTVITRLKSEAREHLRFDNEEIADIDIQSCQPMIFCSLLAELGFSEISEEVNDKDFYKFIASVLTNTEYDLFEFKSGERKSYKLMFMQSDYSTGRSFSNFVSVLAKIIKYKSGEDKARSFINLMYELADGKSELNKSDGFITEYKKRVSENGWVQHHYLPSALPKRMQSKEVAIMFGSNGVASRLNEQGIPFTTIHDAILVSNKYKDVAHSIMLNTFTNKLNCDSNGLKITAKTEILHPSCQGKWTWNNDKI